MNQSFKRTIWLLYGYKFFSGFVMLGAVLIPFFTEWGGINLFQVQILQSVFVFAVFAFEVPTGTVADTYGKKVSIVAGCIIMALGASLYGSIPNFWVFVAGEVIIAFGLALVSGADQALLYDVLRLHGKESQVKQYFGYFYTAFLVGLLISGPIGSLVAVYLGLNAPMLSLVITALAMACFILLVKEPKGEIAQQVADTRYLEKLRHGTKYVINHKLVLRYGVNAIIVAAAGYFVIWLYQSMLLDINVPIAYYGFIHAALSIFQIVISSNFIRLERLVGGESNYLLISALLVALGYGIVFFMQNMVGVFIYLALAGGIGLTRIEYVKAHIQPMIESDTRATVLSTLSMFQRLFQAFLNPLVGYLAFFDVWYAVLFVGLLPLLTFFVKPEKVVVNE